MMNFLDSDDDPPLQINVTPMVDVIFAILAFFVVATAFLTRSRGLPVNLPSAATGQAQTQSMPVVTVDAAGNLAVDRQPIPIEQLPTLVQAKLGPRNPEQPMRTVAIEADRAVSHGRVVEVMDRLRQIPNLQLAIATRSSDP